MNISIFYPEYLGDGRKALLNARLTPALTQAGYTLVSPNDADAVVTFDDNVPPTANGKQGVRNRNIKPIKKL